MIFLTVGTQLPFERLVQAMDGVAGTMCEPVIAQTGTPSRCLNLIVEPTMSASRYLRVLTQARVVVAHAGIGTVLAAQDVGVPVILVPRRAELGEHRNDHQIGTVRALIGRRGITGVWDTKALGQLVRQELEAPVVTSGPALDRLVSRVRTFIG